MFAKKSLGQNFLQDKSALEEIIKSGEVTTLDTVLEIGPGRGALTKYLLDAGAKVIAIEKDAEMINILNEKFQPEIKNGQLKIINEDILEIGEEKFEKFGLQKSNYKMISNIPYYITGEIIRKFLSTNFQPKLMVLLIQKEVADRIIAKDNKESLLSISVKVYCSPKIIKIVRAGSFFPRPKVDSAIILFKNISKEFFIKNKIKENIFFEVVRAGFSHKRKKVTSNLKKGGAFNESKFENSKLDQNIRAEDLKLEDWIKMI